MLPISIAAPKNPGVARGAYILSEPGDGRPDVILIGTGSEVELCVKAQDKLKSYGVKARVVSMPSWDLFDAQDESYVKASCPRASRSASRLKPGLLSAGIDGLVTKGWSSASITSALPRRAPTFSLILASLRNT